MLTSYTNRHGTNGSPYSISKHWARSWSWLLGSQPKADLVIYLVVGCHYFSPGLQLPSGLFKGRFRTAQAGWYLSVKPVGGGRSRIDLPSQLVSITAPWLVPNCTAVWQRNTDVSSSPKATMRWCSARTWTHDLWIITGLMPYWQCHHVTINSVNTQPVWTVGTAIPRELDTWWR